MKQGNRNGTQLLRQNKAGIKQEHKKSKTQTEKKPSIMPKKGGVKIGEYHEDDKWRCKTCKFIN
jgi:hypothetical protein